MKNRYHEAFESSLNLVQTMHPQAKEFLLENITEYKNWIRYNQPKRHTVTGGQQQPPYERDIFEDIDDALFGLFWDWQKRHCFWDHIEIWVPSCLSPQLKTKRQQLHTRQIYKEFHSGKKAMVMHGHHMWALYEIFVNLVYFGLDGSIDDSKLKNIVANYRSLIKNSNYGAQKTFIENALDHSIDAPLDCLMDDLVNWHKKKKLNLSGVLMRIENWLKKLFWKLVSLVTFGFISTSV